MPMKNTSFLLSGLPSLTAAAAAVKLAKATGIFGGGHRTITGELKR